MADGRGVPSTDNLFPQTLPTDSPSPTCALNAARQEEIEEMASSVSSDVSEWDQDPEDYSEDSDLADEAYNQAFSPSTPGLSRLLSSTDQAIYPHPSLLDDERHMDELEGDEDYDEDDDEEEAQDQEYDMESDLDTPDFESQDPRYIPLPHQLIKPHQFRSLTGAYTTSGDTQPSEEDVSEDRLLELQARRLASEHRRKLFTRVPVGGRNGKQWKASDLPLRVIRQIIHLVAISIVSEEVQIKVADGDDRIHFGKRSVGLTIAHIRARSRIAPLRSICRAWKEAAETIPFWSELATVFGFPYAIRSYHENDCLITRLCWVCHFARFPLSQPVAYVRSALGTIWICKNHLTIPFCGRCLRSRVDPALRSRRLQWLGPRTSLPEYTAPNEDVDPGLRITEDDDGDDDDEHTSGGVNSGRELYGPNMPSCQRCRFECLKEAVSRRDPTVWIDLENNEDLECFFLYVERAQGSAESTAVNLLERRWLTQWTRFHDLATQVVQFRKIDPVEAAPADADDMRAIFKASKDIEGDGYEPMDEELEVELANFVYETAVAREEDAIRNGKGKDDESDSGEYSDGDKKGQLEEDEEIELTPGEFVEVLEMATETWVRQRIIDGFWVSPHEQRALPDKLFPQSTSPKEEEIIFDTIHPLSTPLLEYGSSTVSPHLDCPLPPSGGTLDQKANDLYFRRLRSILLPGLNQIARLCTLQKDPLGLASRLNIHKLMELLRLPGAWVHGGLDHMEHLLDQTDRIEQHSVLPASTLMPSSSTHRFDNTTTSERTSFAVESATAKVLKEGSPLSSDLMNLSVASSHSASPNQIRSSPPTSLSPSPCVPAHAPFSSTPSVHQSAVTSNSNPRKDSTTETRTINHKFPLSPKTSHPIAQVPCIPVDVSQLGPSTKNSIKRAWWDACEGMRRCMCSICLRGLGIESTKRQQEEEVMSDRGPDEESEETEEESEERGKRKGGDDGDIRVGDKKQRIRLEN